MISGTYSAETIDKALSYAMEAHRGQGDKAGRPYILHCIRVGMMGATEKEMLAGFLHDVIEDTNYTARGMLDFGIPPEVVDLVWVLTREEGESYDEYIWRVALNKTARRVKMHDLRDNTRLDRAQYIPQTQADKYRAAYRLLAEADGSG